MTEAVSGRIDIDIIKYKGIKGPYNLYGKTVGVQQDLVEDDGFGSHSIQILFIMEIISTSWGI